MKSVLVGVSGGVDSSTVAALLKEKGYKVGGVFFKMFDTADFSSAEKICKQLDIPFYVEDISKAFKNEVIDYFVDSYFSGLTPNPCAICNRKIKFASLVAAADKYGYDLVATGHYAQVGQLENGRAYLASSNAAEKKDQSYFLSRLNQEQLSRVIFPLEKYNKDEVRKIAAKFNLDSAEQSDSQEICFIPDDDYLSYLKNNSNRKSNEGCFVSSNGEVMGKHPGIVNFTIGQRKGLGISFGKPVYVTKIDASTNNVTLGTNNDLFASQLLARDINWVSNTEIKPDVKYEFKIRSTAKRVSGHAMLEGEYIKVTFDDPQRAITPGQILAIYENDMVVCSGVIIGDC